MYKQLFISPITLFCTVLPLLCLFGMDGMNTTVAQDDSFQSFSPAQTRLLDSPLKTIQQLHQKSFVGNLEPDRLLVPFRRNAKIEQPNGVKSYGGWDDGFITGHFGGHYLSAASRMYAATSDDSFKQKVEYMVQSLDQCQQALGEGYLAAFPKAMFDRLETDPHNGMVVYYTIHKIMAGLIDAARYCDSEQAYQCAVKMSDYFAGRIAKLTPDQIELMLRTDHTENPGNEFGGMAEALVDLYVLAKSKDDPNAARHLEFARVFCRDWFISPLADNYADCKDRLSGLHGNTHIAGAIGAAKVGKESANQRYQTAAGNFWRLVTEKHSFVNGGNSFNEKLRNPNVETAGTGNAQLTPLTEEECNTNNMLKLTRYLIEQTGFPGSEQSAAVNNATPNSGLRLVCLGDYFENALYNHILAQIEPIHGYGTYHCSLRPGDYRMHIDQPYCCQGTGIENAARFNDAIYFHQASNLYINLFVPSELNWTQQGVTVRMETEYPANGKVRITVCSGQFTGAIALRIPEWLDGKTAISVNGKDACTDINSDSLWIHRADWRSGDVIELNMPVSLRIRESKDDPNTVSFFYGPVLLAGELGRDSMPESDIGSNTQLKDAPVFPVPYLAGKPGDTCCIKPVDGQPLRFTVPMRDPKTNEPVVVRLAPFYLVQHQRYAVYWKVQPLQDAKNK